MWSLGRAVSAKQAYPTRDRKGCENQMPLKMNWLLAVALALAISGCSETLGSLSAPKVAERDPDNPQTASANIASLSDVVERRPNDPVAFNQRGIAGRTQPRIHYQWNLGNQLTHHAPAVALSKADMRVAKFK